MEDSYEVTDLLSSAVFSLTRPRKNTETSTFQENGNITLSCKSTNLPFCAETNHVDNAANITDEKVGYSNEDIKRNLIGFVWGVLASLFFAVSNACTQALQGAVPDQELATLRGIVLFLCVAPYFIYKKKIPDVESHLRRWLPAYSVAIGGFSIFMFMAVKYIPLGVAGALLRLALLGTVTILARVVLKETINMAKILSLVLSVVAVILVIQPSFIFGSSSESTDNSTITLTEKLHQFVRASKLLRRSEELLYNVTLPQPENDVETSTTDEILGYVLMTLAGVSGAVNTVIQKARLNSESPLVVTFWASIVMTAIPLILCLITELESLTFPTDINNILFVLGHLFASALSLILTIRGVSMTTAILITLALSMQIFFLIISQYTVLKSIEPGKGNWIEILGAVTVFLAAIIPPIWVVFEAKADCNVKSKSDEVNEPLLKSEQI